MAKDLKLDSGEGQTPLDNISGLLVPVKDRGVLNNLEAANNTKAFVKYLKPSKKLNLLSTGTLCEIHKDMFGDIWAWAGEFRKGGEKNIGVPAVKIGAEFHRLLFDAGKWEEKKMEPQEIAVRIHHRLVWIHPFENGNGRWARLVANLYLFRKGLSLIEWPQDPKIVSEVFKPKYLLALKKADGGTFELLIELHKEYTK